jgi:hypothetical protein
MGRGGAGDSCRRSSGASTKAKHAAGTAAQAGHAPVCSAALSQARDTVPCDSPRQRGAAPQLHFVAAGEPIVTEEVAAVLARIVRSLQAREGAAPA